MRQLIGLEAAASTQSQGCTAELGVAEGLEATVAVGEDVTVGVNDAVGVAVIEAVAVITRVDVEAAVVGDPDGLEKPEAVAVPVGEPAKEGVEETVGEGW